MKIYLDLLPEGKKEEIRKKKAFKSVLHQEVRLLVPVIFFIVVLVVINYNVRVQLENANQFSSFEQTQDEYRELKIYEEKFKETNSKVATGLSYQDKHLQWSNVFSELSGLVPDDMYLLGLNTEGYKVTISGKAKTRENILLFQEKIRSSECFTNINVPLPNLVNKENIAFQIDFEAKDNCLKSK